MKSNVMKINRKDEPTSVIDRGSGFIIERPYDESSDGWRRTQLRPEDVPSLQVAADLIALFEEVNRLRRKNWQLEQELKIWRQGAR